MVNAPKVLTHVNANNFANAIVVTGLILSMVKYIKNDIVSDINNLI